MIILLSVAVKYGLTKPPSATFAYNDEVQVLKVDPLYLVLTIVFLSAWISPVRNALAGQGFLDCVVRTDLLVHFPVLPNDCICHFCDSCYFPGGRTILQDILLLPNGLHF